MLPHFAPFGNHSFSASPPPASPGPVTGWRRRRYRPRLTVVARSARGLVGLPCVQLSLQATRRLPTPLSTPHLHVAWTVLDVLHQTVRGLRRDRAWFEERQDAVGSLKNALESDLASDIGRPERPMPFCGAWHSSVIGHSTAPTSPTASDSAWFEERQCVV
jgi:hypothetical protein